MTSIRALPGLPREEIAQYLGHSSVEITREIYDRFSPTHLRRAAAVLNFDRIRKVQ